MKSTYQNGGRRQAIALIWGYLFGFVCASFFNVSRSLSHFHESLGNLHEVEEVNTTAESESVNHVVVFVATERYDSAIVSSVVDLRLKGAYHGDVVVIMEEEGNFTTSWVDNEIRSELANNTIFNSHVIIFTAEELWDSLLTKENEHLRDYPAPPDCVDEHRTRGHSAYYMKSLMYHPRIVDRWETVLYMDGCTSIHSPHIHEIFEMREIRGHVLAAQDPWRYGQKMMGGHLLACANETTVKKTENYVGGNLSEASYFTTGFVIFDAHIVRRYGSSSSDTILEILHLFHELSAVFNGDQLIISVYWAYIRRQFRIIPYAIFGSPRVPYEFLKRMPKEQYIVTSGNRFREVCTKRPAATAERFANALPGPKK